MSNTRHAARESAPRQERFASSAQLQRGLMANLVAKRCSVWDGVPGRVEQRKLVWWLQYVSHRPGGLDALAEDLRAKFADRIGSPSMLTFGQEPRQIYSAAQVRAIRREVDAAGYFYDEERFPLKDDHPISEHINAPSSYPAATFTKLAKAAASDELGNLLEEICLRPEPDLAWFAPWWFPGLVDALLEHKAASAALVASGAVMTTIAREIHTEMERASKTGRLALLHGVWGRGKSFAAKLWCDINPDRARFAEVPSGSDDIGFYRAIAKSLGVSINLNSKAQQLRDRIEDSLEGGNILLCLDEAHQCWPPGNYRQALPGRVSWIMRLYNKKIPVVLITTPQFFVSQGQVERRTGWASEQFTGRIYFKTLPQSNTLEDLTAVGQRLLPGVPKSLVEGVAGLARGSGEDLRGLMRIVDQARLLAGERGSAVTGAILSTACDDEASSRTALSAAMASQTLGRRRSPASPPQSTCSPPAQRPQPNFPLPNRAGNLDVKLTAARPSPAG